MRYKFFALAALLCAASAPAAAQAVQPEQVVRVQAPAAGLRRLTIGTVLDVRRDTLIIQTAQRDTIRGGSILQQRAVPLSAVRRLEVEAGTASRTRGAVLGTLIGTASGLTAAALHMRFSIRKEEQVPCPIEENPECQFAEPEWRKLPYPREKFWAITGVGTVLGTVTGAVFSGRRWRSVPVAPAVSAAPGGGMELSGTLRF